MRLREEEEYYRKGIYREYQEKRKTMSKKEAIDKMVKESLGLEDRYDDYMCRSEYARLERIIKSEQSRLAKEEKYYRDLDRKLKQDDCRYSGFNKE